MQKNISELSLVLDSLDRLYVNFFLHNEYKSYFFNNIDSAFRFYERMSKRVVLV